MPKLMRALMVFTGLILILAVGLAGFGLYTVRRSFPAVEGQVRAPGLNGTVEVVRDEMGVPHIYAQDTHDLFFAQGYVHAQDRFWQMDFWRHISGGRLSEMFGASTLESDRFLRTLGWARIAQEEWGQIDPFSREILRAYADGVNAYLADHQGAALSLEYAILKINNKSYVPEPWTPVHSLAWAKVMAWDLGGNMGEEMRRAELLSLLGPERAADLLPPYPYDLAPQILPDPAAGNAGPQDRRRQGMETPFSSLVFGSLSEQVAAINSLTGGGRRGLGSNNWVLAGSRTESGMPLLANDPHLGIQMPSIWYEVGLHCRGELSEACPFDVTGFSFAGAPGVIIGHNQRIAWGMTNVGPDVQDLFIEKVNPANPLQYEADGQWTDMESVKETLLVAGEVEPDPEHPDLDTGTYDPETGMTSIELEVRTTRHGPIISEVHSRASQLEERAESVLELPESYAIALQWTALQPNFTFRAIWKMNMAQNFDEFREALRDFAVPSQNLIYADVDGNIGYQMPGRVPIRASGNGSVPVPGWTGEYEWTGTIPFEELPYSFNPPQGYIATANQAVVGPDYPYFISQEWDIGYRAKRINELIQARPTHTLDSLAAIQSDTFNPAAEVILPYLTGLSLEDPQEAEVVRRLAAWNRQNEMHSNPAAIFNAFWVTLLRDAFTDELPFRNYPSGGSHTLLIVDRLLQEPNSPWWDNANTPGLESRDDILRSALAGGLNLLRSAYGSDLNAWTWGQLHTATFRNASLGESGIGPIESLFNRGPFATSGGSSIVNATAWDWTNGFTDRGEIEASEAMDAWTRGQHPKTFDARQAFRVESLPSMRMLVDLGNLDNSQTMHTTGQSGHAYHPHYIDMAEPWSRVEYHPMLFSREAVEAGAASHLVLTP